MKTKLKSWRRKLKLSQAQAAAKLGVPIDTLQNWEQGRNEPKGLAREMVIQRLTAATR